MALRSGPGPGLPGPRRHPRQSKPAPKPSATTAGKDAAQSKSTYPALLGIDGAKAKLDALAAQMHELLAPFGERADALAALSELAVKRER